LRGGKKNVYEETSLLRHLEKKKEGIHFAPLWGAG